VDIGLAGHGSPPRIHAEHPGRVAAAAAIEHPHPQHGLGFGDVVAEERERVAVVDVGVRGRLAVGAERRLQGSGRGGGAQPGVAVHVRRADARLPDHPKRVVLLEEQLAGGVETDPAPAARLGEQIARADGDPAQGGIPIAFDQSAALANQRGGEPVGRPVGLPAVTVLDVEAPVVDAILLPAADPTIRSSLTAMSMPSPLECRTDAVGTHRSTSAASSPSSRCTSTRAGQDSPRPNGVR
jgi:hypothetical protein